MSTVSVRITNLPQIKAAFNKAPTLMSKNLNLAIKKSLIKIQGETILNVHPDRGINVVTGGLLSATERPPIFENLKGTYLVDIFYAIYVHDGTSRMKARPFLLDAVNSQREPVDNYFKSAVQDTLDEIARMAP